jgi:VWFA-related protein
VLSWFCSKTRPDGQVPKRRAAAPVAINFSIIPASAINHPQSRASNGTKVRTPNAMRIQPRFLISLSALAFASLQVSPAQQSGAGLAAQDQSATTLRVKGPEVLLAVTVRDKRGEMVNALSGSDLTLTEDGRPQQITSFTRDSKAPLRVGLAIDTSSSLRAAMNDERKAVGKFLETMLPDDPSAAGRASEAFLLHFDRQVELLEDFTGSRDKLQHELDSIGPSASGNRSPLGPETSDEDRADGRRRGGAAGTQLYDAIYLAADELMKLKDGRKAVILFSDGLDRGSKESLNDAIDSADRANMAIYTVYFKGQGERTENPFPNSSRRGGVGFPGSGGGRYPGGGGGYPGGGSSGGDRKSDIDGKKIMEQIATRTGGRYFEAKKTGDLNDIYTAIADELRNQYVLTYTPDKRINEDEYHKIVLKAKKDDLSVATREGYYTPDSK